MRTKRGFLAGGIAPPAPFEATPVAYSIGDAAKALGISRSLLYDLIGDGELQPISLRRRRVIPRSQLEALVQRGRP